MNNVNKIRLLSIFIIICFQVSLSFVIVTLGSLDNNEIRIQANDILTNFKFDTFNNISIGNDRSLFSDKLCFQDKAEWSFDPIEDIQIIDKYNIKGKIIMRYKIRLHNTFNVFTNVRASQGCSPDKWGKEVSETINCGYFHPYDADQKKNIFGMPILIWVEYRKDTGWQNFFSTFKHYDFGDIRAWNELNNHFSGNLKMSFDIKQNPLPNAIVDYYGNELEKKFDYISVTAAGVENFSYGKLSENDPIVNIYEPDEFNTKLSIVSSLQGWATNLWHGHSYTYDPQFSFIDQGVITNYPGMAEGDMQGTNMHPLTKEGNNIWSPNAQKSMKNCSLSYNIYDLSPLVEEYGTILTWKQKKVTTYWKPRFGVGYDRVFFETENWEIDRSTGIVSTALSVKNQYIQAKFYVDLEFYTEYDVKIAVNNMEEFDLALPEEYYDSLVWTSSIHGFEGGSGSYTPGTRDILDIISWLPSSFSTIIFFFIVGAIVVGVISGIIVYMRRRSPLGGTQDGYGNKFRKEKVNFPDDEFKEYWRL